MSSGIGNITQYGVGMGTQAVVVADAVDKTHSGCRVGKYHGVAGFAT